MTEVLGSRSSQFEYYNSVGWDAMYFGREVQGYTNPRREVAVATKSCMVVPKICRSSACNLLLLPFWLLEF